MIFVSYGGHLALPYAGDQGRHARYIENGEICLIIKHNNIGRSIVLHPTYGLVWTLVSESWGEIMNASANF